MLALALALAVLGADPPAKMVTKGRQLFHDPGLGATGAACADCHATVADEAVDGDGRLRAGHSLFGVGKRGSWRGDDRRTTYRTLAAAVGPCVEIFLRRPKLEPSEQAPLVAFLESISLKRSAPVRISPGLEANLDYRREKYLGGDAGRGRTVFYRACHGCHPHGQAGLGPAIATAKPEDVAKKVREGNGLLRGSRDEARWSPFFGTDRLTDRDVADVSAYLPSLVARSSE